MSLDTNSLQASNRPHFPRNQNRNDSRTDGHSNRPVTKAAPIPPGSQTKSKLKAFQFIEGKPKIIDSAEKENEVEEDRPRTLQETPVKMSLPTVKGPPPSTPATRLPLADLIGNPDNNRVEDVITSPEENVMWLHAQTPSSSHPGITPARKRKRAKSSSPVTSSQNEQSNFFGAEKESFDVQGLQQSLKTPQADPAADLWNRYHASANDGATATKSVAFAHLIKDSSPRSSENAGSVSGLRRWASCGVEWPTSTTKRRRISGIKRDDQAKVDIDEQSDGELPKISTVGALLERMKETLQKPQERVPDGPSSSSPLPERSVVPVGYDLESPSHRLPLPEIESIQKQYALESPWTRLSPVMEDAQEDAHVKPSESNKLPVSSAQKVPKSSSEFGDDELDVDMFEAIENKIVAVQMQTRVPIAEDAPQVDAAPIPTAEVDQPKPPDQNTAVPQPEFDEFGDDDDDLFAADLEQVASKYDSQAQRAEPNAATPQTPSVAVVKGVPPQQEVVMIEDDEFGDDDFDGEELIAAEAAATQAFQGSHVAPRVNENRNRAIQRYKITVIQDGTFTDEKDRQQMEKVLVVEEPKTKLLKNITLRQSWVDTPCTVGSFVHVIGTFSPTGQCIVDNTSNILILHPDHLISATVVSDSFGCIRRAVLQDRVKSTSEANAPMMYGHILHELFQEAMKANAWDHDSFEKSMTAILPRHFETMVEIGVNLNQVREHLRSKVPEMQGWADMFVGRQGGGAVAGRNGGQSRMSIDKLLDVEEHIWSPYYGLKGNVDGTVQVTLHDEVGERQLTVPFELKTGKRVSEHHVAQTALYTLLVSDRYDIHVTEGILYYLETSQTSHVQSIRHELIHLIMKRNELACFVRERLKLPPMLDESRQRMCTHCYAQTTCFLYHKLAEDGTSATLAKPGKYEELVKYLTPVDEAFFQKWDRLLTKEESEMKRFTRELWTMVSTEREKLGRCFANVVLVPGSAEELRDASKINRFQYSFVKQNAVSGFSFAESQITVGEPIVVSDEQGHYALANGYVTQVTKRKITVAVGRSLADSRSRRPGFNSQTNQDFTGTLAPYKASRKGTQTQIEGAEPLLYRLDKDEFANGMATARNNVLQIMDDTAYKAASLRSLIVQGRRPTFKPASSALPLQSQGCQTEMNSDQKAAVDKVMAAQDYSLVLGMPGTGKTTTIAHIIRALVAKGKSVLLTSYTHTAVDNILLKLRNGGFDVLRLGVKAKIHPEVQDFAILAAEPKDSLEELTNSWLNPPVVATTCLAISHPLFSKRTFDYCIVDEASQITLPVCLGPIRMAKTFVLVGDHFQLPPLVQNKEAAEGGLDVSLFKLLSEGHSEAVVTLEHQYRMCADIMLLSNRLIYDGRLKCGNDAVASRCLDVPNPEAMKRHHYPSSSQNPPASSISRPCRGPSSPTCHLSQALNPENKVLFFNTDALTPYSNETASGNRITNPLEITLVTQLVHTLLTTGILPTEIGVITFYRSQLALLRQSLKTVPEVELHTADKFQGRDKEVVVVSFVRANGEGSVGELLKDWRRVNVAITRGRSKLILVGSKKTLEKGGPVLKGLVDICDAKGWMRDLAFGAGEAHYFPEMATQMETQNSLSHAKGSPVKASSASASGKSTLTGRSPVKRRILGEIAGNESGSPKKGLKKKFKVPSMVGKVGEKALLGSRPVLRDIVNDMF